MKIKQLHRLLSKLLETGKEEYHAKIYDIEWKKNNTGEGLDVTGVDWADIRQEVMLYKQSPPMEWIRTTEKMPEEHEKCLFIASRDPLNFTQSLCFGYRTKASWVDLAHCDSDGDPEYEQTVLWWSPISLPPEIGNCSRTGV